MKIILQQNVPNLGQKGDLKDVASGYARNHLLPRGLAVEATPQKLREWEKRVEKEKTDNQQQEAGARKLAEELGQKTFIFRMPAGEGGRLFGSVTTADIADKLSAGGYQIDKKKIDLPEQIKSVGQYQANLKLYPGVKTEIAISVEKETQDK